MKDIPLHLLQERTNTGLQIDHFRLGDPPDDDAEAYGAHRDDHYIFRLLKQGSAHLFSRHINDHTSACHGDQRADNIPFVRLKAINFPRKQKGHHNKNPAICCINPPEVRGLPGGSHPV